MADQLSRGTVKWFDSAKGYGFIRSSDGEIFVHGDRVDPESMPLRQQDYVEFELNAGPKGWRALNVRRIDPAQ